MPEPGPFRIIEIVGGEHYCEDCYEDIEGLPPVVRRRFDGVCACCAALVADGYIEG